MRPKRLDYRKKHPPLTARQEQRMAAGVIESAPSDYPPADAVLKRQSDARRALEDRRMMRELGLLEER